METKKILWVEDDADLLMGLVRPLKKDGHGIIVAGSEKEALEAIKKFDFDLILFDIIIPTGIEKDSRNSSYVGMELLETLLIEMKVKTPIIVLSVVHDSEMINKMYEMGVKKVLPKGAYLPTELKETVYAALDVS